MYYGIIILAGAKCTVSSPLLMDENDQPTPQVTEESFWPTTEGKYKFIIKELPPQLQLFHVLLKVCYRYVTVYYIYYLLM